MGVKRRYDTSRRRAQAEVTRTEVLEAAGRLFGARGYAATTVDEIAAEAGVSRETIFKVFGAKRELLRGWVERVVAGPDELPVAQQTWMDRVRGEPVRRRRIDALVRGTREIHDRSAGAIDVLRAAAHADADIATLWEEACAQRRADVEAATAAVTAGGSSPPRQEVVDAVYALTSPELHDLLVRQSGWTPEQFDRWVARALRVLAFGPGPSA